MPFHTTPIDFATPEYDEVVGLRTRILREPLGLAFTTEFLEVEYADVHIACYENGSERLVGCLLIRNVVTADTEPATVQVKQVAVRDDLQRRGIGRQLMAAAEAHAQHKGISRVIVHAREAAAAFYDALGYVEYAPRFEEVGIPHRAMQKRLV